MNQNVWVSTVIAALVLTACGSSGSGSGVSNTGGTTGTTPTTPVVTTTNPTFQSLKADGSGNASTAVVDSAGKYTYTYNGAVVDVSASSIQAAEVANLTIGSTVQAIGGTTYSYSRFGGIAPKDQAEHGDVFYVGKQTVTMPTTGTAVYKGFGVGVDSAASGTTVFSTAPISFDVNFGQKTLNAKVDVADTDIIFEQGTITGSRFAGNLKDGTYTNGNYSGAFFGPNAEELGGVGQLNPDASGNYGGAFSFGAKKQ